MPEGNNKNKSKSLIINSFTLIELLIVVAIIAILAGMLLPALNKARAQAVATECTGRLHQLSMSVQSYFNDWNFIFISGGVAKDDSGVRGWSYHLDQTGYLGAKEAKKRSTTCPTTRNLYKDLEIDYRHSYGAVYNSRGSNWPAINFNNSVFQKAGYSRLLLLSDSGIPENLVSGNTPSGTPKSYMCTSYSYAAHPYAVHSGRVNALLLDGHTALRTPEVMHKDFQGPVVSGNSMSVEDITYFTIGNQGAATQKTITN